MSVWKKWRELIKNSFRPLVRDNDDMFDTPTLSAFGLRALDECENTTASTVATVAGDGENDSEFLDFTPKQRMLISALRGKARVPIDDLKKAVYGNEPAETSALEQLIVRINKRL